MFNKIVNAIKNLITNEECHEIHYKDFREWFENKKTEFYEDYEEKTNLEIQNLKNKLRAFNKDLMSLSQKKISDKYPENTKHKINDSIIDYVGESKQFIKKILPNEEDDQEKILNLLDEFDQNFKEYEDNTKSRKEFLEDIYRSEIHDCEESLNDIKNYVTILQKRLSNEKFNKINIIDEQISELETLDVSKDGLDDKKQKIIDNLNKMNEMKEKFLDKIEELKSSPDFSQFHDTISKRKIVLDKINETKEIFEHDFKKIRTAIEIYQIRFYKNLFKKYLNDPFNTLIEDEAEELGNVLPDLRRKIELDEVRLASENKRIALDGIEKLNKDLLFHMVQDYKSAKREKITYDKILSTNKVMSDYSEIEYKIDHINNKIKDQKEILKDVTADLKNLELTKLTTDLEKNVHEAFGTQILIVFEKKKDEQEAQ
ncbi:hypothetical protein JXM83_01570 [Candidatus Woesearchaeota archaeon]|nr:hypothetical protein [Candidatus Woesearchaeota archaeon]